MLFVAALSAARKLLSDDNPLLDEVTQRLVHPVGHLRRYYWLDFEKLNEIYRYKVEESEYGSEIINELHIYPDSIPEWIAPWAEKLIRI